jgi:hypothetical protein
MARCHACCSFNANKQKTCLPVPTLCFHCNSNGKALARHSSKWRNNICNSRRKRKLSQCLSTTPRRCMRKWRYSSTDFQFWHDMGPRARLHAAVNHWIGGWVRSRVCLDAVEKRKFSCTCRESNRGSPALSLNSLSYVVEQQIISYACGAVVLRLDKMKFSL